MFGRKKVAALLAEFLGTAVLTLLILSVQRSQLGLQYFVALSAGLVLAVLTYVFVEFSGAFFNPALAVGLWTARKLSTLATLSFVLMQCAGGFAAFGIYSYFGNNKLTNVGGHFTVRILIAESVGAFVFAFLYAATLYKSQSNSTRAAFSGLAYTSGILVASSAAIGLLNPAVALGIRAWATAYLVGPFIGAIIGINLYTLLFAEGQVVSTASVAAKSTPVVAAKKPAAKRKTNRKK
ncbi:MAG TPA: aquaporin [Candidatus Saccharimonadales bacterium]|nr:aquaporin [Candidatus Saccharimonadales bacterium]